MPEPVASSTPVQANVRESKPTGGPQERLLVPSVSRQQNAATVQQITSLIHRLKLATDQIDAQQVTIAELQVRDEENRQALDKLTLRIESCEKSNEVLRVTLEMVTKSLGVDLSQTSHASDSANASAPSHMGSLTKEEEKKVLKIVKAAFLKLYGITKFHPREHGLYPTVSKQHMEWPHRYEGDHRVVFHRFDLGKDCSHASPINNEPFQAWVDLSLTQGATLVGLTELPPRVLNRDTVSEQCAAHFKYLQRRVRDYFKESVPVIGIKRHGEGLDEPVPGESQDTSIINAAVGPMDPSEDGMSIDPYLLSDPANYPTPAIHEHVVDPVLPATEAGDVKPIVGKRDKNSKENMRSRSQGKLTIRTRKRSALNGTNKVYQTKKYDGFFTIGGTSDDEAVEVTNEYGNVVEEFHARPWTFASDEVTRIKCQEAVDATPDPQQSSRQTIRRRGTNTVDLPSVSKTVKNGVLSWMVKPEILKENPQWLTMHRVYPSGPEWREEEPRDPAPKSKASKRVKLEDMASNLDQIHKAREEWEAAQQKVENYPNATLTEGGSTSGGAPM
ncbi:hypothetical protein FRC11_006019 [Ceratobasidium sp. 423]|nr:hypothetical protein FRC11_006019 [Ceratobasidium sp. 423]